ncbi:uncharacterized protein LY89DRAFT_676772 [Mollisia scopiformis]|uniref:Uncharacterized protein n=1 Tax=Mollisia scopiformis TaxID=149040 RepID=A0A132B907_MOLSC|nr:uncharacterized protein LY89DRAFT_676772 [Mollisia scopiformis]KUJ08888.1 hypothetical protein LY89DRAFT_676772 [Mollisia scopiformis]
MAKRIWSWRKEQLIPFCCHLDLVLRNYIVCNYDITTIIIAQAHVHHPYRYSSFQFRIAMKFHLPSKTQSTTIHQTEINITEAKPTVKTAWSELRQQIICKMEHQAKEIVRNETRRRLKSILKRWEHVAWEDKRWLVANLMTTDEDIYTRIWRGAIEVDERARFAEREERRRLANGVQAMRWHL